MYKLAQTCPNWSKFAQTGIILSKLVEIYLDLSEGVFLAWQRANGGYLAITGYDQMTNSFIFLDIFVCIFRSICLYFIRIYVYQIV